MGWGLFLMRVVVKVGTSTLAHKTGCLNIRLVETLCKTLADLQNAGHQIVLVSSGAIGMGVGKLQLGARPSDMATKQAAAAVGQCELMYTYDKLFTEYNHTVAQVLLTAADIDLVTAATKELEPFALSGAVLDGDTDRALSILRTMEEKRVRPFSAFAGIYSTYIDLYRVRACLDAGLPVSEVAKKLKMHEYRTKLYAAAAKKTTSARLGVVLSLCREADLAIKSESSDYGRLRALVCEAAR